MDETSNVLEDIIGATGLPEEMVRKAINSYVLECGKTPQNLTIDEVRDILVNLLQDVFLDIKGGDHPYVTLQD